MNFGYESPQIENCAQHEPLKLRLAALSNANLKHQIRIFSHDDKAIRPR